ncbi:MAG: ThiF family adenylyltransferase [Patescibacteria group bacterium]|nr:ThiF family adenylyltransferase [Patescibacteria group bacterium]
MELKQVKIIGLGGIGGWLVKAVAVVLDHGDCNYLLTIIDGDKYEDKNHQRQQFRLSDTNEYKAYAQANWLDAYYQGSDRLLCKSNCCYIDETNIAGLIQDGDIVLLCVDNHATRKLVSDHCSKLKNITLISGGNDAHDGNVMIYRRINGRDKSPSLTEYHPEIANPADKLPDDLSCEERIAAGDTQTVAANFMAASIMLNALCSVLANEPTPHEVYFGTITNTASPRKRK